MDGMHIFGRRKPAYIFLNSNNYGGCKTFLEELEQTSYNICLFCKFILPVCGVLDQS